MPSELSTAELARRLELRESEVRELMAESVAMSVVEPFHGHDSYRLTSFAARRFGPAFRVFEPARDLMGGGPEIAEREPIGSGGPDVPVPLSDRSPKKGKRLTRLLVEHVRSDGPDGTVRREITDPGHVLNLSKPSARYPRRVTVSDIVSVRVVESDEWAERWFRGDVP